MTRRERVIASLNFKQPDRVPIDFNGHKSSGINVLAYRELRKYLDLPPSPLYIYDLIQQLAIVEQDVLDKFGVDTFQLGCDFDKIPEYWKDWELEDGTPCKVPATADLRHTAEGNFFYNSKNKIVARQPKGCYYFEQTLFPLADTEKEDFSDIDDITNDVMWLMVPSPPVILIFTKVLARDILVL